MRGRRLEMEAWMASAKSQKTVESVAEVGANLPEDQQGLSTVVWRESPILHDPTAFDTQDGVIFDWARLHGMLRSKESFVPWQGLAKLNAIALKKEAVVTTVSLDRPWAMIPIDSQAQKLSFFVHAGRQFKFLKGPPAQLPSRDAIVRLMETVAKQLHEQGVNVSCYCSDFVVVAANFDEGLHKSAQVHKALKGAGFAIDGPRSCLVPRAVCRVEESKAEKSTGVAWSTLDTRTLKYSDSIQFLADAFTQWAVDTYHWGCLALDVMSSQRALELFLAAVFAAESVRPESLSPHSAAEVHQEVAKMLFPQKTTEGPTVDVPAPTTIIPTSQGGPAALRNWSRFEVRCFLLHVLGDQVFSDLSMKRVK